MQTTWRAGSAKEEERKGRVGVVRRGIGIGSRAVEIGERGDREQGLEEERRERRGQADDKQQQEH